MKQTVAFRFFCGEAGDLQHLLIAETNDGYSESILLSRVGLFRSLFLNRAKKKLVKQLELKTGRKYYENTINNRPS